MFLSREEEVLGVGVVLIIQIVVYVFVFLILSVLTAQILRFAAWTVVKSKPSFKTAFYISAFSWVLFTAGAFLSSRIDVRFINLLPLVFFFTGSWILGSRFLIDIERNNIGFGKGSVVSLLTTGIVFIGLSVITFLYIWIVPFK